MITAVSHRSLHGQTQHALATGAQDFILTPLAHLSTMEASASLQNPQFYRLCPHIRSTALRHAQKCLSPCRLCLANTLFLPGVTSKTWPIGVPIACLPHHTSCGTSSCPKYAGVGGKTHVQPSQLTAERLESIPQVWKTAAPSDTGGRNPPNPAGCGQCPYPTAEPGEGLATLFWRSCAAEKKKNNKINQNLKLQRARVSMTPQPWDWGTPLGVGRPEFQLPAPWVV